MESLHSLDRFAMVYAKILGISYDAVENPNRGKFQQKKTYPENDVYAMLKLFFCSKVKDRCLCKYLILIFLFNFVVFNLFSLKNS
jgi:hypothetical protein